MCYETILDIARKKIEKYPQTPKPPCIPLQQQLQTQEYYCRFIPCFHDDATVVDRHKNVIG